MHVLGIVGGVASGKSLVSEQLQSLGAAVLDADKVGHAVLREPKVEAAVRARWGSGVFDESGRINRRAVARIVFAPRPDGPPELSFLEQLTHPRITARLKAELEELRARGNVPAVVLDAALLFRGGWDKLCDRVRGLSRAARREADAVARDHRQLGYARRNARAGLAGVGITQKPSIIALESRI
jgi:dephospho-CoA kinase